MKTSASSWAVFVILTAFHVHAAETNVATRIAAWRAAGIEDTWGIWSGGRYRKFGADVIDTLPYAARDYDRALLNAKSSALDAELAAHRRQTSTIRKGAIEEKVTTKRIHDKIATLKAQSESVRRERDALNQAAEADHRAYIFTGEVSQVAPDGLLMDHALLAGYPGSVVDGQRVTCIVTEAGTYSFTTVLGARRTVPRLLYGAPVPAPEKK
jgi:hypothetical protein